MKYARNRRVRKDTTQVALGLIGQSKHIFYCGKKNIKLIILIMRWCMYSLSVQYRSFKYMKHIFRTFSLCKSETLDLLIHLFTLPQALETTILLFGCMNLTSLDTSYKWIFLLCICFFVTDLFHITYIIKFIHVEVNDRISFLSKNV